jgi:hypothetical protein
MRGTIVKRGTDAYPSGVGSCSFARWSIWFTLL